MASPRVPTSLARDPEAAVIRFMSFNWFRRSRFSGERRKGKEEYVKGLLSTLYPGSPGSLSRGDAHISVYLDSETPSNSVELRQGPD
ncbi:Protein of unknown function [Pyronema omphalodes CBS 100304]|uniref:Uncharacterized protein n=1 Tax=Pyronema omphalodes (strain CBS 100304) TaxID=1076935 RepID=U4L523_PYROM|nr:Protein of unknown function [Pyronema omphalodes CBS 100304]